MTQENSQSVPVKNLSSSGNIYLKTKKWILVRNISAIVVFLVTLIVYVLTSQPTVPFWDCGEFIACSYTLGVPHPPGATLFILWGRLFSLLPLGVEIAQKINWMSSLFNALAIGVFFIFLARIINRWFGQVKNAIETMIVIVGAAAGSFFAAFGTTYWNNGLEAEVYGFAMLVTSLVLYFALLWSEKRKDPRADRYILLSAFLMYLGIGAHMTVLIIMPPLFLFYIIVDRNKRTNLIFWLSWFILFMVAIEFNVFVENLISAFIIFGLASIMSKNKGSKNLLIAILCIWATIQLVLLFKGTTIPGLIFKEYGLSGLTPNIRVALSQLILVGVALAALIFKSDAREWRLGFLTILLAIIAFSLNSYTIIRSRANPYVDENDPETITAFRDYMDRKQYGQETMWQTMFRRKGKWVNQFGTHMRMGFWGFFRKQWLNPTKIPLAVTLNGWIFFIFALIGLTYSIYKKPKWGLLLFLTTLISTLGLIIYLNFSDGTAWMHMEVRDRDYFYTPGFMMMGGLIGLGFASIMSLIYRNRIELKQFLRRLGPVTFFSIAGASIILLALTKSSQPYFIGVAALCIFLGFIFETLKIPEKNETRPKKLSTGENALIIIIAILALGIPSIGVASYWFINNRSRNYIPFDYAYNILQSCDENAILYTNGDNDTFPLWFLQAVEKVRTDVKIVNLSLINTNWYIKQLKNNMGVHITLSDEQIDRLRPYPHPLTGGLVRIQDIMVRHIFENANVVRSITQINADSAETTFDFDPPIYFAVTVSNDNKKEYDNYLSMEGLVYKVTTEPLGRRVNAERMKHNIFDVYRFTGLKDSTIYKDENSTKLLQNYTTGFITLAMEYQKANDTIQALNAIDRMFKVIPYEWRGTSFAGSIYGWSGQWDKVDSLFEFGYEKFKTAKEEPDSESVTFFRVYYETYMRNHQFSKVKEVIHKGLEIFPDSKTTLLMGIQYHFYINDEAGLLQLLTDWLIRHPDDKEIQSLLQYVKVGGLDALRQPVPEPEKPTSLLQ